VVVPHRSINEYILLGYSDGHEVVPHRSINRGFQREFKSLPGVPLVHEVGYGSVQSPD
jgi:hypothetical protein